MDNNNLSLEERQKKAQEDMFKDVPPWLKNQQPSESYQDRMHQSIDYLKKENKQITKTMKLRLILNLLGWVIQLGFYIAVIWLIIIHIKGH